MKQEFLDILNKWAQYSNYDREQKKFNLNSYEYEFHRTNELIETILNNYDDSNYFLSRQAIFAGIGVVAMFVISKIDYRIYKKWAYVGYGLALALLAAVLIPGIRKSK